MAYPGPGADYTVKVTLSPANEPLSIELVSLQCTITPTPPSPVVYLWRSSTQNHNFETSLSSSMPRTFVTVNVNQPLFGRYFCHVLLASNYTTLAVGHITIFLSGESHRDK